ncbi:hypothetical protein J5N97_007354 [Dioscorea zingiberensis]|uniref:Uncharacterized protein n=1 Tax=Dioscorea zingiberensis TaxID=325984 RepID=A0A9D5HUE8_9LILI|nr:hypothetical protein J5N97_007354 [Dioscorea zingiberensis]
MTQEVVAEKSLVGKQLIDKDKQLVLESGLLAADAANQPNYHPYPEPLETYENVVSDPNLFMQTLQKLHRMMGTKFMVPIVGGKELNLHQLFVEVTSRGGMLKVIKDRRWREVIAAFNFPSTATNASFVLRKYYMSLIFHYEQIHFFKSQGRVSPPSDMLQNPPASSVSSGKLAEPYYKTQDATQKRRKSNDVVAPAGSPLGINCPVAGVIDGKCEHGYFVTVSVGTTKLKGILYHSPQSDISSLSQSFGVPYNTMKTHRRRRKKRLSKRDPAHPKPNRSGYNFFFAEQHARLRPLHPGKDREISKMIGELWNKLTEVEKAVYQEKGAKDKERYRNEMAVYRQRLQLGPVISDAVPIQQCPADPGLGMDDSNLPLKNSDDSTSDDGDNSEGKRSDTDSEIEETAGVDADQ